MVVANEGCISAQCIFVAAGYKDRIQGKDALLCALVRVRSQFLIVDLPPTDSRQK